MGRPEPPGASRARPSLGRGQRLRRYEPPLPGSLPLLATMARGGRLGLALGLLLALVLALQAKPTVRKERVVRPDSELGERPPEDNQSFQYDHEAFLGKEDSKTFDQLSPDESKERLG